MYWHDRVYKESQTVTRNADTVFEIPENVPLAGIMLEMTCKKESGNPLGGLNTWRLLDALDAITLKGNGSYVIMDIPGDVLHAINQLDHRAGPQGQFREYSQDTDRVWFYLTFGRYWHDPELYIPANRFDSLDLTISFTGTSTYWQEDIAMDIVLSQPMGAGVPASRGFLIKDVFREWTTVADETKYLTLPTANAIRRLYLQGIPDVDSSYVEETNMFNVLYDIELALRSGAVEVYHGGSRYIAQMNALRYGGPFRAGGWIYHTADKGFNSGLGYVYRIVGTSGSRDGAASGTVPTPEGDRNSFTQKMESYEADSPFAFEVIGLAPECVLVFPFDEQDEPGTWLDPRAEGDVLLNVKTRNASSAADGTVRVVLDKLAS